MPVCILARDFIKELFIRTISLENKNGSKQHDLNNYVFRWSFQQILSQQCSIMQTLSYWDIQTSSNLTNSQLIIKSMGTVWIILLEVLYLAIWKILLLKSRLLALSLVAILLCLSWFCDFCWTVFEHTLSCLLRSNLTSGKMKCYCLFFCRYPSIFT